MNELRAPLLLPRPGSRILRPDACIAALPTDSGPCRFVILPNDTLLAWWEDGDAQIWNCDGLLIRKLVEATGQPLLRVELLGKERFCIATDSDTAIYTSTGHLICRMPIAGSLRDVHVGDGRVIAVSTNAVSVYSFEGHRQASLASEEDLNYDRCHFYIDNHIVLFKTLNRQEPSSLLERLVLARKKTSGELYLIEVFTDDLKRCVETIPNPHKKRMRTVLHNGEILFTLAEDGVRTWAPGMRLLNTTLHTTGMFYGEVLPLESEEYLSYDAGRLILFAIRDGSLSILRRWKLSFLQRVSETCALVKGWDESIALLDLKPPFDLRVIQA